MSKASTFDCPACKSQMSYEEFRKKTEKLVRFCAMEAFDIKMKDGLCKSKKFMDLIHVLQVELDYVPRRGD